MSSDPPLEQRLSSYVISHRERLVEIIRDLVRIPSENTPPNGREKACQEHVADFLRRQGWEPDLYYLAEMKGLRDHPLYWPGRDYAGRPNLGARREGAGGGRSLLLSGHIDTVPAGTQPWTRDPFGGEIEGNRLYGRGSNDMKGGVGTNLFVIEALRDLGIELSGDLLVETVVDEEFGGVNGTLAGRLAGFNAQAAIISEPSFLRICPAQRGGRTVHIKFHSSGGVLTEGKFPAGVVDQVSYFLAKVREFATERRDHVTVNEYYAKAVDPVPVSITKIFTSPWGTTEPITVPETCLVEMYWQLMPGETQEEVENEFLAWFNRILKAAPDLFPTPPQVVFPIRWLPGSFISNDDALIREFRDTAIRVLGKEPLVQGIEGPCDMYVFHQLFKTPAILWGARGGNTHAADEYLDIDTVVEAAQTLLAFVCRWCGIAS